MNDPHSSQPPPIVRRRKGLGCFATGCLIVVVVLMLLGIGFGSLFYVAYHGGQAYISDHRTLARTAAASDEQYQDVLAKLAPFGQAMNEGRAATLEITPDELNILIARSPQFEAMRGQLFLAATGDQIVADVSTPLNNDPQPKYFNGRAKLDASYASNGFALFLRHIEPLDSGQPDSLFTRFMNNEAMRRAFSQQISRSVNEDVRKQAEKDPATADLLQKLRTIVVHEGKIIVTIDARPGTAPALPATPVGTPVAADSNQT